MDIMKELRKPVFAFGTSGTAKDEDYRQRRRLLKVGLAAVAAGVVISAVPYFSYSYLDVNHRIRENIRIKEMKEANPTLLAHEAAERTFVPSPWEAPAGIFQQLYLFVPSVFMVAVSALVCLLSRGNRRERYGNAGLIALAYPLIHYAGNLPWALYYWDAKEWLFSSAILLAVSLAATTAAFAVNGIAVMRKMGLQKR